MHGCVLTIISRSWAKKLTIAGPKGAPSHTPALFCEQIMYDGFELFKKSANKVKLTSTRHSIHRVSKYIQNGIKPPLSCADAAMTVVLTAGNRGSSAATLRIANLPLDRNNFLCQSSAVSLTRWNASSPETRTYLLAFTHVAAKCIGERGHSETKKFKSLIC